MADPGMELPRGADFEDDRPVKRTGKGRFSFERLLVLGLVTLGALLLGVSAELWPKDFNVAPMLAPFQRINWQPATEAEEIKQQIAENMQEGNLEQAKKLADKLVEIDPKTGYLDRGRLHYIMKEFPEAIEDFTQALKQDPASVPAIQLRALTHLRMENKDKAIEDAKKLSVINPRDGLLFEGSIYVDSKDWDKAIEAFNKAIEADKKNVAAYVQLYQIQVQKKDYARALEEAKRLSDLAPSQSLVLQGDALSKLGKTDEALAAYDDALGHDPTNATALNNRAYFLANLNKDLDRAAKDIAGAIDLSGEEPAYVDTRGFVAYMRGDFKGALADFNKALKGADEEGAEQEFYAEIYYHRGLVHKQLGEPELSKEDFEKAKALGFTWTEEPKPAGGSL
ncbi:tetratricopeptide repeat protein [bacterium]|nr:tetratricopeptide repeat protein [bacterium]